jgi:hypothetical protein
VTHRSSGFALKRCVGLSPPSSLFSKGLAKKKRPPDSSDLRDVFGSPYGTLFATFSCRHRQKCSVSCNSCGKPFRPCSWRAASLKAVSAESPASGLACGRSDSHACVFNHGLNLPFGLASNSLDQFLVFLSNGNGTVGIAVNCIIGFQWERNILRRSCLLVNQTRA